VDLNYFLFQVFSILMVLACVKLLLLPSPVFAGSAAASKYARSSLTDAERRRHAEQLTRLFAEQEVFRRVDLRAADVAAELGIPEYVLSQVVNEEFGRTFNDLVREYRVRAVQAHLVDPAYDHYTMEAIGREVGFRARASFYSAFRELTGQSPTEYRKAQLSGGD
jgi:AraC-like DNA-binding protein